MQLQLSNTAFWDVDMNTFNDTHQDFIIARVFMHGNLDDTRAVIHHYKKEEIKQALQKYRGLDKHTIAFAQVLGCIE
ncbi:MAG TPA: hypothetical protein PLJ42_02460 [Chitinophagales bacterium]|jgi:hypothetical protein|nr:hypothetical protein [Chitinophagales bacterium]MBP6155286.1 hypothetical protein [Chitinophagales bacterium]HQV77795.1 hypothetical protein [Chitinophagales bacterium]HQW78269.1 hypothetical protein [Chitinophagales bacterium]HRB69593.1 hypothetical protein [Chitinophagales bacterium]